MSALTELQESVAAVAGTVGPSVVGIGSRLRGSGVVIAEGRVLTNAHNIRGSEVTVRFADGRTTRGTVKGMDWDGDLAVVEVDTTGAPPVALSAAHPTIGSAVFAAAALSSGGVRVSFGFVSSVARAFRGPGGRRISGSVEHTAPLAPGSSGSPLLDADGALIGISTNRVGEGFYLALPVDAGFRATIDGLARGESRERPQLGIAVAPAHVARRLRRSVGLPDRDGVLIRGVEPGSPAEAAGILEGDLVVAVGGIATPDVDELHDVLAGGRYPFDVVVVRGMDERTVTVTDPAAGGAADPGGAGSSGSTGAGPLN
jgi:serine protease Do